MSLRRRSRNHQNQVCGIEQPLGYTTDVVQRHCVYQAVPFGDVVGTETLLLKRTKLRSNACVRREGKRKRAREIGFGVGKFLIGSAGGAELLEGVADDGDRLADAIAPRRDFA